MLENKLEDKAEKSVVEEIAKRLSEIEQKTNNTPNVSDHLDSNGSQLAQRLQTMESQLTQLTDTELSNPDIIIAKNVAESGYGYANSKLRTKHGNF